MKYKLFCLIVLLCSYPICLLSQYSYGVTGLLHTPSAEMQPDKTVMIGGGFLNESLTPSRFNYNTYNYYNIFLLLVKQTFSFSGVHKLQNPRIITGVKQNLLSEKDMIFTFLKTL